MRRLVLDVASRRAVWRMPPWVGDRVQTVLGPDWEVAVVEALADSDGDGGAGSPAAARTARGAEVYVGFGLPREVYAAARGSLRWVHSAAAGVTATAALLRGTDVRVTSSAGVHAEPMADWVLGAVLHFARGFDVAVRAQADHHWAKEAFTDGRRRFPEIAQLRVAIVGLGGIGRAVARRFAALGSVVRGVRRHPDRAVPGVSELRGPEGVREIVRDSDVLVVATPGTAETEHLVDGAVLATLAGGATVVNVSRGRCLDERALLEALDGGPVCGAALDVFAHEPLPPDHPLWRHPRVLLTPHVSSVTDRYWERETELLVDNVSRYIQGRALLNLVDLEAGY